jgi:uncharacterized membrane protein YdjX (TVP38/TMEM64 family)
MFWLFEQLIGVLLAVAGIVLAGFLVFLALCVAFTPFVLLYMGGEAIAKKIKARKV